MPICFYCKQNVPQTRHWPSAVIADVCKNCFYVLNYSSQAQQQLHLMQQGMQAVFCPRCNQNITGYNIGHICNPGKGVYNSPSTGATMPPPSRSRFFSAMKQKEARLIYEPALAGYSLKFSYDQALVEFIKKVIPSHKRTTSGPPDWIWYFPSEYYPIVKTMFEGHKEFKLTIVTEEEVLRKQQEQEEASRHVWAPQQHSMGEQLQKFRDLLVPLWDSLIPFDNQTVQPMLMIENWTRNEATKIYRKAAMQYHPDRNNGDGTKMSELNAVWAILKEGYYIK